METNVADQSTARLFRQDVVDVPFFHEAVQNSEFVVFCEM